MANKKQHITPALRNLDYWLAEWLDSDRRASEHTAKAYKTDIRQFLERAEKPFDKVREVDILEYQSYVAKQYESPKTRARKVASVCSFYAYLNNHEAIKEPLNLDRIDRPKLPHQVDKGKFLTEKQVVAIIKAASADPVHGALLRMLYLTGCRVSEVLGVRWRDLTPLEEGGEAHIVGKGKRLRDVYLPADLWADVMALRGEGDETDHVFPFSSLDVWRIVKRAGIAAKIDGAHPHQLRHAFVSHALAHGNDVVAVSQAVGHASLGTTSLYAHADGKKNLTKGFKVK